MDKDCCEEAFDYPNDSCPSQGFTTEWTISGDGSLSTPWSLIEAEDSLRIFTVDRSSHLSTLLQFDSRCSFGANPIETIDTIVSREDQLT
jgi:hypothetical protein